MQRKERKARNIFRKKARKKERKKERMKESFAYTRIRATQINAKFIYSVFITQTEMSTHINIRQT